MILEQACLFAAVLVLMENRLVVGLEHEAFVCFTSLFSFKTCLWFDYVCLFLILNSVCVLRG